MVILSTCSLALILRAWMLDVLGSWPGGLGDACVCPTVFIPGIPPFNVPRDNRNELKLLNYRASLVNDVHLFNLYLEYHFQLLKHLEAMVAALETLNNWGNPCVVLLKIQEVLSVVLEVWAMDLQVSLTLNLQHFWKNKFQVINIK